MTSFKRTIVLVFLIHAATAQFITLPQYVAQMCNYEPECIDDYPSDLDPDVLVSAIPKSGSNLFFKPSAELEDVD
jgi:hypothetical protein